MIHELDTEDFLTMSFEEKCSAVRDVANWGKDSYVIRKMKIFLMWVPLRYTDKRKKFYRIKQNYMPLNAKVKLKLLPGVTVKRYEPQPGRAGSRNFIEDGWIIIVKK